MNIIKIETGLQFILTTAKDMLQFDNWFHTHTEFTSDWEDFREDNEVDYQCIYLRSEYTDMGLGSISKWLVCDEKYIPLILQWVDINKNKLTPTYSEDKFRASLG